MGCSMGPGFVKTHSNSLASKDSPVAEESKANEENDDLLSKMTFINKVVLFQKLPRDQHPIVAAAVETKKFSPGQVIIRQGDSGNEFFLIFEGSATVQVSPPDGGVPTTVATLKTSDYFGENALLRDEPRTATIIAESEVSTFSLTRSKFQAMGLHTKLQFSRRRAVGGGAPICNIATQKGDTKNDCDRELISKALRNNANLTAVVTLDDSRVNALVEVAWKETVQAGKELIVEGSTDADYFYIIQDGCFEVFVSDRQTGGPTSAERVTTRGESKFVSVLSKGDSFGELALLYFSPRAATVTSKVDSSVWVIDRNNFKKILMQASEDKIAEYKNHLCRVDLLSPLLEEERSTIARALTEIHYIKNETIIRQGEQGNTFYILFDGELSVSKDGQELTRVSASIDDGTAEAFGEKALLNAEARAATITVTSESASCLALDRETFNFLIGPLETLQSTSSNRAVRKSGNMTAMMQAQAHVLRRKIGRLDLDKVGLLGCGGFGVVELVEHKDTKETFALKALSKGHVVNTSMQQSVMNEKNIMLMSDSEFVVKLYATYNTAQSLLFLLEVALGGELYATYNNKGFYGSEKHARYYLAGVIFAFEHLHDRFVIYRDLKPENVLLNSKGHPKLTDMGLAKFVVGKTFTTCGTPDYFAPEVISTCGHTSAVDWWTLGIFLFELMTGHPPFESPSPMQIYAKVMKGIGKVSFPPRCSGPIADLVKSLLKRDPADRLPMKPGKVQNLRKHKWFATFSWEQMESQTMDAPYKPAVKSMSDLANFNARKEDMPPQIHYQDDGTGWDKDFAS